MKFRLNAIENYMIYYGEPNHSIYEQLAKYDLVIIEPQLHMREKIDWLKSMGTVVIGYLSIVESPQWNQRRFQNLVMYDFLWINGQKIYLHEWDAFIMDLRQLSYRDLLFDEAKSIIKDKGCSGLLLDTLDDIDNLNLGNAIQREFQIAYEQWLQVFHRSIPDAILIQNRGFHTIPSIGRYLDGILWEDWNGSWKSNAWIREQIKHVRNAQKNGIRVFSICESIDSIHRTEAEQLGFLHLTRDRNYHNPKFFL